MAKLNAIKKSLKASCPSDHRGISPSSPHPFIQIDQGLFFLIIFFFYYTQQTGTEIWLGDKENRLKAERARFLYRMERRAKPETELALTRRDKTCVFSIRPPMSLLSID
ncbi:hypothetical protein ACFLRM_00945 [Acidobacteriota bacterium]